MVRKSQLCEGLEEEHTKQREREVGMNLAGLKHRAGGRVMGCGWREQVMKDMQS